MHFERDQVYHVYNQGNNRQKTFATDNDYEIFFAYFQKLILPHADAISYCLMPNHFHFMLLTKPSCERVKLQGGIVIDSLTDGFRNLLSGYTRVFNARYEKTGSLFRQKTKANLLSNANVLEPNHNGLNDYVNCFHYIHNNPVTAALVDYPEQWKWSSAAYYAGVAQQSVCNKQLAVELCII
jgi:putative transposase